MMDPGNVSSFVGKHLSGAIVLDCESSMVEMIMTSRHPHAADGVAAFGNEPGQPDQNRRKKQQIDDGVEIRKIGQCIQSELLLPDGAAPHLFDQGGELSGVSCKMIQSAAQYGRRGFTPGSRKNHEGSLNPPNRHFFLILVFDDMRHEIGPSQPPN